MDESQLRALAEAKWLDDGSGDAYETVRDLVTSRSPQLPALIAALCASTPETADPSYVGASVVEDMDYSGYTGAEIGAVLRAVPLSASDLFAVLRGVYPDFLRDWGVREYLAGVLSPQQFDWLGA